MIGYFLYALIKNALILCLFYIPLKLFEESDIHHEYVGEKYFLFLLLAITIVETYYKG